MCQSGALCALAAHFSVATEPAIITLPTGTGKTGVLLATPYLLGVRRALLIVPSIIVRSQTVEDAKSLTTLKKMKLATSSWLSPRVGEITSSLATSADWKSLEKFDFVIGIPNSVSPAMSGVAKPPSTLFDLVLIDEGHHRPAKTWNETVSAFPNAKVVLVTATPFREDRTPLGGKIVYSYSIAQALKDGVLSNLTFQKAPATHGDRDVNLAKQAETIFERDKNSGLEHYLAARVGTIDQAKRVKKIYEQNTRLQLEELHSKRTNSEIQEIVSKLKTGKLHGVICVRMLDEGFDLPNLKIAVAHDQHKSLLPTVQFLGRFLRMGDNSVGKATLIAEADSLDEAGYELYQAKDILARASDLIDRQEAESVLTSDVVAALERDSTIPQRLDDLIWDSLRPYCQVKIFRTSNADLSSDCSQSFRNKIIYKHFDASLNAAAIITKVESRPFWITLSGFTVSDFELVLIHFDKPKKLLFVCSTFPADSVYKDILTGMQVKDAKPVPISEVRRVLRNIDSPHFFTVGLSNGLYGAGDSYRTIAGPAVEHSVISSDSRSFHCSHLFGSGTEAGSKVTIGFSKASKVWTGGRTNVSGFVSWCANIGAKIVSSNACRTNTPVDDLPIPVTVAKVPQDLLGTILADNCYMEPPTLTVNSEEFKLTEVELSAIRNNDTTISLTVKYGAHQEVLSFTLPKGQFTSSSPCFKIRLGRTWTQLSDYFNEHPPVFFFWNFSRLQGNQLWEPSPKTFTPFKSIRGQNTSFYDWTASNVDIKQEVEVNGAVSSKLSIHDFLRKELQNEFDIVFYNQGSREYADFICLKDESQSVTIALYHCKKSGGTNPGLRLKDLDEVILQALNSVHFFRKLNLITDHVSSRDGKPTGRKYGNVNRQFEKPSTNGVQKFKKLLSQKSKQIKFVVVIAHPGISLEKLERRIQNPNTSPTERRVLEAFAGLEDTLKRAGGALSLVCSEK